MKNHRPVRIDDRCFEAIKDIQEEIKKKGIQISQREASRLLAKYYFKIKKRNRPVVVWNTKPSLE